MRNKELLKSAYDQWITKGYEHFSDLGPDKLSIRKISVDLNQPRTSFYYYFENQDEFLNELLIAHWDRVSDLLDIAGSSDISTCTELFKLLEDFPIALNFQNQLFKNREVEAYNQLFLKVYNALFEKVIARIVYETYDTNLSKEKLRDLMLFTAEVWFSRLYSKDNTIKSKMKNLQEIMKTLGAILGNEPKEAVH